MWQVQIDGKGADTVLKMKNHYSDHRDLVEHIDHDSMCKLFLQWLREAPKDVTMLAIGGIVLEHQISYHLSTKSEEERLQDLNMDEENVTDILVETMLQLAESQYAGGPKYVDIGELRGQLKAQGMDLSRNFVWGVLKGLEFHHPEFTVSHVGEGFVSIKQDETR